MARLPMDVDCWDEPEERVVYVSCQCGGCETCAPEPTEEEQDAVEGQS